MEQTGSIWHMNLTPVKRLRVVVMGFPSGYSLHPPHEQLLVYPYEKAIALPCLPPHTFVLLFNNQDEALAKKVAHLTATYAVGCIKPTNLGECQLLLTSLLSKERKLVMSHQTSIPPGKIALVIGGNISGTRHEKDPRIKVVPAATIKTQGFKELLPQVAVVFLMLPSLGSDKEYIYDVLDKHQITRIFSTNKPIELEKALDKLPPYQHNGHQAGRIIVEPGKFVLVVGVAFAGFTLPEVMHTQVVIATKAEMEQATKDHMQNIQVVVSTQTMYEKLGGNNHPAFADQDVHRFGEISDLRKFLCGLVFSNPHPEAFRDAELAQTVVRGRHDQRVNAFPPAAITNSGTTPSVPEPGEKEAKTFSELLSEHALKTCLANPPASAKALTWFEVEFQSLGHFIRARISLDPLVTPNQVKQEVLRETGDAAMAEKAYSATYQIKSRRRDSPKKRKSVAATDEATAAVLTNLAQAQEALAQAVQIVQNVNLSQSTELEAELAATTAELEKAKQENARLTKENMLQKAQLVKYEQWLRQLPK